MMPIESGILLKNNVSCNFMLKYYITVSLRQFTKTSNQFFYLSRVNKNLEICMPVWFVELNESNQFWGILLDNVLINWDYLKNTKQRFRWKLLYARVWFLYDWHPHWNSCSKNFILNSRTVSIFPALDIKKLAIVGKILWRFDIILHMWLIHLLFH